MGALARVFKIAHGTVAVAGQKFFEVFLGFRCGYGGGDADEIRADGAGEGFDGGGGGGVGADGFCRTWNAGAVIGCGGGVEHWGGVHEKFMKTCGYDGASRVLVRVCARATQMLF